MCFFFVSIHSFDPLRHLDPLSISACVLTLHHDQAEKERAEKLLEAAKAEAVLRVGYWTDFFPIDSSTDCHVEIPMFIEQNNFQVKFLKGLIEVFV